MRTRIILFAAAAAALLSVGCGPQFDPASKVQSLRVFAVQKSEPYGKPGGTEHLTMLWDDPRPDGAPVQIGWISGCNNPDGDLYYNCFKDLASAPLITSDCNEETKTATGNTFCFKIPDQVIEKHTPSRNPSQQPYGLSYVFFTACKGRLKQAPDQQPPFGCFDSNNKPLGPDDFIVGYTAIYSYEKYTNKNPVIDGVTFNDKALDPGDYCIDDACTSPAPKPTIDCSATPGRCVPSCPGDGDSSCPEYTIKPTLEKSKNQEDDPVSKLQEQMWIRYYADGGSLGSQVRLLNDATTGWNNDYGTTFRAPKKKGPMHIWAVVQDNRGGASWVRVPIMVQ